MVGKWGDALASLVLLRVSTEIRVGFLFGRCSFVFLLCGRVCGDYVSRGSQQWQARTFKGSVLTFMWRRVMWMAELDFRLVTSKAGYLCSVFIAVVQVQGWFNYQRVERRIFIVLNAYRCICASQYQHHGSLVSGRKHTRVTWAIIFVIHLGILIDSVRNPGEKWNHPLKC